MSTKFNVAGDDRQPDQDVRADGGQPESAGGGEHEAQGVRNQRQEKDTYVRQFMFLQNILDGLSESLDFLVVPFMAHLF